MLYAYLSVFIFLSFYLILLNIEDNLDGSGAV
jgi:hypothetical protein